MTSVVSVPAAAETVDVWFGTSTSRRGPSKGIYHGKFDTDSGKLTDVELAAEVGSPGFLAKHPSGKMLYAAASDDGTPAIVAYAIEGGGGEATLVKDSSVPIGDGGAAHVSVSRDGKVVLSAQYGAGSTACFSLDDSGSLVKRTDLQKHPVGSGVIPNRQDTAHAHWTGTSPDDRFAFVPDLGLDKVVIYKLDTSNASLQPHGYGICPPGSGPRHMKFHPNEKTIYVLNELALSVTVFDYDAQAGTMTPIQTIETLSEAVKAKEVFNSSSEIRVHPNGKFVYAANRGNDTITVYSVDASTGKLSLVEVEPIRGAWPRNFNLDPSGKWLLAAGQASNTVAIFKINQDTGELQFTRDAVYVPSSICVLF
ncbi:6-phosphogluconolactonase [Stieleria neptunia]|uniref:6-phosphogluconolactonase n=1 Tax=Stieleria neptunia TaxID=2527979 RepID=A0A518I0S8_9BACT|nr:lactonase family protein [Stieleria neptunia]QDV46637.1 6-phosphogluconolactonase [Stieleria neptunia]